MQNEPIKQISAYESELKLIWIQMESLGNRINELQDRLSVITENSVSPTSIKAEKPLVASSSPLVTSLSDIKVRLESFNAQLGDLTSRFTI